MVQYSFLVFSNNTTQKRILFANESPGERILKFRLGLCCNQKWISHINTLLEADIVASKTHFEFGCPYKSPVGDSLATAELGPPILQAQSPLGRLIFGLWPMRRQHAAGGRLLTLSVVKKPNNLFPWADLVD
jgi:hypothetical protein